MEPSGSRRARVDAVLAEALKHAPELRRPFLEEECQGDRALLAEVEWLLSLAERPAPALDRGPAADWSLWQELLGTRGDAAAESGDPSPTRFGPWRPIREIGRGGMAQVYEVERADGGFTQTAALKLILPGLGSEEILRRFELERQILASLSHTNIAHLLDGGQAPDGRPFFVMDYVEGRPIDRYCDEERLTVDERLDLFVQAARAVEHAHRNLVVHRDLKPSNIAVTAEGEVKLLDFGIAKLLLPEGDGPVARPTTRGITRLLTPDYASPEQVRGESITTASDIYQLGLLLYELLTGRRAQETSDGSVSALERAVCETDPPRPSARLTAATTEPSILDARRATVSTVRRKVQGDLDNIVLRALRKEPGERYASVGELVEDLERHRAGLPVRARPATLGYRARKFVTRHRVGLAASLAVSAAVGWATVTAAVHQLRAAREADRAAQVEQILGSVLSLPNPRAAAQPPEARDFADHATLLILDELEAQPRSQAHLLTLAGRVYNALGLYDSSIDVLERALGLRSELFGADSLEVADTLEALAQSQHYASRYLNADGNLRRALAIRRSHLGEDDPATLRAAVELGDLLHTQGRLAEAEEVLRQAAHRLRELPGGRPAYARVLRDLGNVLRDRGAVAAADDAYRRSIGLLRELHGDPSQPVAVAETYYARLLIFRNELARAEELLTGNLAKLRAIYDGEHPLTGTALRNLGYLRMEQGRFREAEELLGEARSVYLQWLGPEHTMVARTEAQQAELALRRGRAGEAERVARRALERFARLEIAGHPIALDARRTLGRALLALGRDEEAAAVLAEVLAAEERLFVPGDPRIATTRAALARAHPTGD